MKHFAALINNGTVENIIVIEPAGISEFQKAVGCDYLISVDERVSVGDIYDSENGIFTRDGVRVYPPISDKERIAALEAQTAQLENALCEVDEANAERFAAIEDALCEIDAGSETV